MPTARRGVYVWPDRTARRMPEDGGGSSSSGSPDRSQAALEAMTITELRALAVILSIDLTGLVLKAAIVAAIVIT